MTHYAIIHALRMLWYPRRRLGSPTGGRMLDLNPWRSLGVVEVVEEAYEASCLMKKLHRSLLTHT